ncbi:MAG: hypothetical protein JO304_03110 [Solirubrobacterales bacterium]|nr:hypothetical protein [Solirubrobacterales bacterium]
MLIAYAPVAVTIRRPWLLALVVACLALASFDARAVERFRRRRGLAVAPPRASIFASSARRCVCDAALMALVTLGFFYGALWLVRAINGVFGVAWSAGDIAFVATLVVGFFPLYGMVIADLQQSAERLYPLSVEPSRPPVSPSRWQRLVAVVGAAGLIEISALIWLPPGKPVSVSITVTVLGGVFFALAESTPSTTSRATQGVGQETKSTPSVADRRYPSPANRAACEASGGAPPFEASRRVARRRMRASSTWW